jgi:hypothetical protein
MYSTVYLINRLRSILHLVKAALWRPHRYIRIILISEHPYATLSDSLLLQSFLQCIRALVDLDRACSSKRNLYLAE